MNKKYYIIFLTVLLSGLLLSSCKGKKLHDNDSKSDATSITLKDTHGNDVKLKKKAEKIVCLADPAFDVIYMLQQQDKLIGVPADIYFDKEQFDYFKQIDERIANKSLPTPGSNELMNIESVIALNPDLVIAQNISPNVIKTLNSMGIAVYLSSSETYDDLKKELQDIAQMTGAEERGKELIEYSLGKINKMQQRGIERQRNGEGDKKKSAYFSWANGRIFSTAGRNSMMNNCLELAEVENVCTTAIDKPNINPETLIAWNPDMIIMWNDSPELFYEKKELAKIEAIKNKQIFNLMPMFFFNPHTFKSICAGIMINNWAYGDNPQKGIDETKEIIGILYGKEAADKLNPFLEAYYQQNQIQAVE